MHRINSIVHKDVEGLLILQEKDIAHMQALQQLALIPQKINLCNKEIDELRASLNAAKKTFKDLELEQKNCEVELRSAEDLVIKYKTQQMTVKKNEDYDALTNQIEETHKNISRWEDRDLELLMKIDEQKKSLAGFETTIEKKIQEVIQHIRVLEEEQSQIQSSVEALEKAYKEAKQGVPQEALDIYENIKKHVKKPKFVVPVDGHSCTGCHLRISNDILQEVLSGGHLACCDQCGRIIYHIS